MVIGSFTLRELTLDDAEALFDLSVACDIASIGEAVTTREEIAADLSNPQLVTVAIEADGTLGGYAWAEARPGQNRVWADVRARPEHEPVMLLPLLTWVTGRAATVAPDRPIWIFTGTSNHLKCALLEAAGGRVVRKFFRMMIDFDEAGPPVTPTIGEGVKIAVLPDTETDRRTMHRIVDTAFEDHFGHEAITFTDWDRDTRGVCTDPSLFWLATVDGAPAAGIFACTFPASGYVDTLGTLREFRGRGLGRALLLTAFEEFAKRGVRRVLLGVDATSLTNAVALYESVGMSVAHEGWRYELPAANGSTKDTESPV